MITELVWYLEEGRFSKLYTEFEEALTEYADARKTGGEAAADGRRKLEKICERHIANAGMKRSPYVDAEEEFFDGAAIDRKACNAFIKEAAACHCYQKLLWEYMGTTGSFTEITRLTMKKEGKRLEDYYPISYKRTHPDRKTRMETIRRERDGTAVVPLFLYSDGSGGSEYKETKAKARFDVCPLEIETCGIDLRKPYDPNVQAVHKGWHIAEDGEGNWERIDDNLTTVKSVPIRVRRDIEVIWESGGAVLYDGDGLLMHPAIFLEFCENKGMLDRTATLQELSAYMRRHGIKKITGVSAPVLEGGKRETVKRYERILGPLADAKLSYIDDEKVRELRERKLRAEQEVREKEAGTRLLTVVSALSEKGVKGTALVEAIRSGGIEVPIDVKSTEDAKRLSLDEKELSYVRSLSIPQAKGERFNNTLVQILLLKKELEQSGIDIRGAIEAVYRRTVKEEHVEGVTVYERTLGAICKGEDVNENEIGDGATNLRELESAGLISAEARKAAEKALAEAYARGNPSEIRAQTNVIAEYEAIRQSTGWNLEETLKTAAAIVSGGAGGSERIFFERPLEAVIDRASKKGAITKRVDTERWARGREKPKEGRAFGDIVSEAGYAAFLGSSLYRESGLTEEDVKALRVECKAEAERAGKERFAEYMAGTGEDAFVGVYRAAPPQTKSEAQAGRGDVSSAGRRETREAEVQLRGQGTEVEGEVRAVINEANGRLVTQENQSADEGGDGERTARVSGESADEKRVIEGDKRKTGKAQQEAARMARLEANYERDKRMLAKEDPAFARRGFYDIGHAQGSEEETEDEIRRNTQDMEQLINKKIKEKTGF